MKVSVFITGDAGFFGVVLKRRLLENGRHCRAWIVGAGDNRYGFVYAPDVAEACRLALAPAAYGVFNVGSDNVSTLRETYRYLIDKAGAVPHFVAATRAVAEQTGATRCDAAAAFDGSPLKASYFEKDGIHLNQVGNRPLAALIALCVLRAARLGAEGESR
jgi:nucleoside-diphosphate-sugar epimerase